MPTENVTETPSCENGRSAIANGNSEAEEGGADGLRGTEQTSEHVSEETFGNRTDGSTDQEQTVRDPREGTRSESGKDKKEAGIELQVVTKGKNPRKGISPREYELALKMANGNVALAADALGVDQSGVTRFIERNQHLNALYGCKSENNPLKDPNEVSTIVRTPADIPSQIEMVDRAEALMQQDREMLRDGLLKAGIKPETITKIRSLDGLARNAGSLLSASLDYTHRLHIYATAELVEEMTYIKEHYLRDDKLDPMAKVFWMRAFNEIADLLGKANDRTMASTQAMVAMMKSRGDRSQPVSSGAKSKPGWGTNAS